MSLIGSVLGIALFASQYGVTCQKCHTVVPHLTAFGAHFLASGDRIPGVNAGPAFPVSAKINVVDSSANQGSGPDGAGLPKAIVDEVELFTAGTIGTRASFFVEEYALDGGEPGALREAWVNDRLNPWGARVPLYAQAGRFTLPLPVDPETFRETYQHYSVYDQTVDGNPFDFFDARWGVKLTAGDTLRGLSAQLFTGDGRMAFLSDAIGEVTPGFYYYRGAHPYAFSRSGYSLVVTTGKLTSESVLQKGYDAQPGSGIASSGGFTQVRYAFDRRFFALGRYEGTDETGGAGFTRDAVIGLGYAPVRNARITIEDVIAHAPQTTNTMNLQVTVGY